MDDLLSLALCIFKLLSPADQADIIALAIALTSLQ